MVQQELSSEKENKMVDTKLPFPWKLHKLLGDMEEKKTTDVVSWLPDGASFKVQQTKVFTEEIMPHYFSQTKFNSFRRQCYIYGFRLRRDGAFYHPQFKRNDLEGSLSLRRNQESDRRKKHRKDIELTPKTKTLQTTSTSFKLPPLPCSLSLPRVPSMTSHRPAKTALSLFEQTFNQGFAVESAPQQEIAALADEIFENNQFVSHHFNDLLCLHSQQLGHVPLDSLDEIFLSEITENQPDARYSGSHIQQVCSI